MKRLLQISGMVIGCAGLFAACEGDTVILEADPVVPSAITLDIRTDNPLYSAEEASLRFKTPGGSVVFAVETNAGTWSFTNSNEAWLAVEKNEYDGTLTLSVERNEEATEPSAEVVVVAGEGASAKSFAIGVSQNAAGTPEIAVAPNQIRIAACGADLTASTTVESNYEDWEFTQTCDWMLVERVDNTLVFKADENTSIETRSVEVKLTAGYGEKSLSETVVVTQDGKAYVEPSKSGLSFDYRGGTQEVTVASNFEWSYAGTSDWVTVTREGDKLTVSVDAYEDPDPRTAVIALTTGTDENVASMEIVVSQSGVNDKYLRWTFEIPQDNATATAIIAGEVNAEINWGDGTVETVTKANPTHVYDKAGTYYVEVSGTVTQLTSAGTKSYLTEITQWGQTGLTSLEKACSGCTMLKTIPSDTAHSFDEVTTFAYAFENCQQLQAIPEGLFDNAVKATDFTSTFHSCYSISKIPEKLFHYNVEATTFYQTFWSAGSPGDAATGLLTEIPAGLFETNVKAEDFLSVFGYTAIRRVPETLFQNCPKAKIMTSLFDSCTELEVIPAALFGGCPEVTSFMQVFRNCSKITSVPELLFFNNPNVTSFKNAFLGCSSLTEIPAGLFSNHPKVENCFGVFQKCTSLTTIPHGLFSKMTQCSDFGSAFLGCTGLESIPADLLSYSEDISSISSIFKDCTKLRTVPSGLFDHVSAKSLASLFEGCTALESLPDGLFAACANGGTFTSTFADCSSLKAIPAGLFDACVVNTATFSSTFKNCTALETLPEHLFSNQTKTTSFSSTFNGCSGLKSLPASLFEGCVKVSSLSSTFSGCTGLESLPASLFESCTALATLSATFQDCTSLQSLPASLFDANVKLKSIKNVFNGCTSLTGESPYTMVNGTKVHLYERSTDDGFVVISNLNATDAFAGCSGLSDYDAMPSSWK